MEPENPYLPPTAAIADPPADVPDEIAKQIKGGWVAAAISAAVTLAITLLAMSGTRILNFSAVELIDVAFIAGMAYGIYRKSRVCAVVMLIYFIASRIMIMVEMGKPSGLLVSFIFAYYFALAIKGTFAYHKFMGGRGSARA